MKQKLKKFVIGGLVCLGAWGLFNILKPDYINVEEWRRTGWDKEYGWTMDDSKFVIEYTKDGYSQILDNVSHWIDFRVKAFDSEGIKNLKFYVDDKKFPGSYYISDDGGLFQKSYTLGVFAGDQLKKGKHTLIMILQDYIGNSTKVQEEFEVR